MYGWCWRSNVPLLFHPAGYQNSRAQRRQNLLPRYVGVDSLFCFLAVEAALHVLCSPAPRSNIWSCVSMTCVCVCFFGALCHEKLFLLPRLAEAETFRQTGGGRRGLHQIQQCRLCTQSEWIQTPAVIISERLKESFVCFHPRVFLSLSLSFVEQTHGAEGAHLVDICFCFSAA